MRRYLLWVGALPVAVLSFLLTQSPVILNPRHIGWLWGSGDIASSFTQWIYFRQSPILQWPLTLNSQFGAPWAKTITYTDTPPLFAVPLKYLLLGVDGTVQYTGLQILLSTYLLVLFGAKALNARTDDPWFALAGGLLISTAPMLLFRDVFFHYSLNVMWVIPAGIYLILRPQTKYSYLGWGSLFFITLTWMPYFAAAVALLWLPDLVVRLLNRRLSVQAALWAVASVIVSSGLGLVVDGFWFNASSSGDAGLGFYNANLLALFNPLATPASTWSSILPAFANATDGQYEGFAFMGLGATCLVLVSLVLLIWHRADIRSAITRPWVVTLIASIALSWFLALGFSLDVGQLHLLKIPIPDSLAGALSIFRSSGRFMTVVAIAIVLLALLVLRRYLSRWLAIVLTLGAVGATLLDSAGQIAVNKAQQSVEAQIPPSMTAAGEFLAAQRVGRVTFIPPEDSAYQWKMAILGAAALRNIPVNDTFTARPNLERLTEERDRTSIAFDASVPAPDEAWVIYPEFAAAHAVRLSELTEQLCHISIDEAVVLTGSRCS